MRIRSKYKIARRLGPEIFDKTSTAKYALRMEQKSRGKKGGRRPRSRTDYGLQLLEKQKARYTYGISERQFSKYVQSVLDKKHINNQDEILFERLENRLDNVVYRLGLAASRLMARQMVSHGHFMVNDRRTNVPSREVSAGDKISIRSSSLDKPLFAGIDERISSASIPAWLTFDLPKKEAKVVGSPKFVQAEVPIDIGVILEFYKR
ncbi:MAG: 30S ribosomal protein S4 [Parcubacteria group bacterium CG11_big_fil_rev_8_21_14_0_20_39_22]|nr:MAG: 30S ribosomal protein S4 [Parcubacteria group bacterium CG11_big_fil_rev_8_21_14_0_20_39_22]